MQRRPLAFGLATLVLAPLAACSKNDEAAPAAAAPARKLSGIEAYAIASKGSGFTMGPVMAANTVYVFFDTTCPHCAHLWASAKEVGGKLKIVWMPIGLLRPQSLPQGATILSAADPAAAMAENEASVLAHGNGITAAGSLDDAVVAQVKANTELFRQLNSDSVPLIVYRNSQTGQVGQYAGAVDAAKLMEFAGL